MENTLNAQQFKERVTDSYKNLEDMIMMFIEKNYDKNRTFNNNLENISNLLINENEFKVRRDAYKNLAIEYDRIYLNRQTRPEQYDVDIRNAIGASLIIYTRSRGIRGGYEQKYHKYKQKYLNLKKMMGKN